MDLVKIITAELGVKSFQVENTVKLLDDGNTIPFIARYRKEATGELDEEQIRTIDERVKYLRNLETRKQEILNSIEEQGKLTPELSLAINQAVKLQELEDLYRPYKQKKRTRAMIAKERGLEPLADLIWEQQTITGNIDDLVLPFVNPEAGVETVTDVLAGARDIIAERVSDDPDYRKVLREYFWEQGIIASMKRESTKSDPDQELDEYRMYADYQEAINKIPPHRVLALNRGENEEALKVTLEVDHEVAIAKLNALIVTNRQSVFTSELEEAIADGYKRLLFPSLERELRTALTETAEDHAIKIFGVNLRNLILQAPVQGQRVMGIDPGYRTGCKVAVVDETGKLLETATIYPHPPQEQHNESLAILGKLIQKHEVSLIAIGNGTASRETETLVAELIHLLGSKKTAFCIVSEAGASVYSASKLAKEEFPELDVSMRGAVSIARRIQDPLAELVKIDPKSIGVGLYQHDVNQKQLSEALSGVVESCVNYVGVDLNTASPSLLQYVAGLQPAVAKNIVAFRETNGRFNNRKQLLKVKRLGEQAFIQAAGFLKIVDGEEPLDSTWVHPESYDAARNLLLELGFETKDILNKEKAQEIRAKLSKVDIEKTAEKLGIGKPTLKDIIDALVKPGRDPREDLPKPIFRTDVLKMEDLKPGMILTGTVRNVIDFGAFVDIGVKQDGLVHLSELSDSYVKHPTDVVAVGDIVEVRVLEVDLQRKRIALSMKQEGKPKNVLKKEAPQKSAQTRKEVNQLDLLKLKEHFSRR
ncbi:MAG TPA: Tex family protein [Bacillota bacterium]|jgi:uncharacterized protein|nr:Tex family protein [Bacillota bacterium]HOL10144.1 Tex family protein [Bacillota bacterium]HPO97921.1 Tex family protein [Bacillota bacterium]